jgi:hypothetical protein
MSGIIWHNKPIRFRRTDIHTQDIKSQFQKAFKLGHNYFAPKKLMIKRFKTLSASMTISYKSSIQSGRYLIPPGSSEDKIQEAIASCPYPIAVDGNSIK